MSGFADLEAVARAAEGEWAADASIRAEFGTKETYLAFRKAEARGAARILGQHGTARHRMPAQTTGADVFATDADAERSWAADASIRAEFGAKETYLAYSRAQARGHAKINGRNDAARTAPHAAAAAAAHGAGSSLAARQAQVRQENVGRQFAGLPPLDIPQQ